MRTLKSFSNLAEAGFAGSLLEAAGIRTLLADEQSSLWSYGMAIPIRLQVDDADYDKALDILKNGLPELDASAEAAERDRMPAAAEPGTIPVGVFVAAAFLFALLAFIASSMTREHHAQRSGSSQPSSEFDLNHDGRTDYSVDYLDNRATRSRTDRNFDGRMDQWVAFDSEGRPEHSEDDNNFDGRVDTWFTYRNGQPETARHDTDFDGRTDLITTYKDGLTLRTDVRPNGADIISRTFLHEFGVLVEERVDEDQDGTFDYKILYDPFGKMSERIRLNQSQ